MEELIVKAFSNFDASTILAILAIFYFYDLRMEKRVEKLEVTLRDLDKRMFAIETMMHMKDCCMLKDEKINKRAE